MLLGLLPTNQQDGIESKSLSSLACLPHPVDQNVFEQFYVYMTTGQTRDGLDLAVTNHMWGHAFMLASSLGQKCMQQVQSK